MENLFILTILVFALISCGDESSTIKQKFIDETPRKESKRLDQSLNSELISFSINGEVEIISKLTSNNYSSSSMDTTICEDWSLSDTQIKTIIKGSQSITGPEWHHQFDHLPCSISGKIIQNEQEYEYSINGGAWFMIHVKDTSFIFGSFNTENNKYFLSEPWVEE